MNITINRALVDRWVTWMCTETPHTGTQPDTEMPKTICGPNLEEVLNAAGFFKRKPLTEEALMALLPGAVRLPPGWQDFARAIERAHGIGGEHE